MWRDSDEEYPDKRPLNPLVSENNAISMYESDHLNRPQNDYEPSTPSPVLTLNKGSNDAMSGRNSIEQLFYYWGEQAQLNSVTELCETAADRALSCHRDTGLSWVELLEINRPGLIPWEENGRIQYWLVHKIDSDSVLISSSSDQQKSKLLVSKVEFERDWGGDYLYLWPKISGYSGLLSVGQRLSLIHI